ncbi:MAG: hypothetical protein IPK66_18900 [Rhodospirillales bacterium]|nr:hypothetical protein [Rhodospirillales bacterium]
MTPTPKTIWAATVLPKADQPKCAVPRYCRETGAVYCCDRGLTRCFFTRRPDDVAENALGRVIDFATLPRPGRIHQ